MTTIATASVVKVAAATMRIEMPAKRMHSDANRCAMPKQDEVPFQ